MAKRATAKRKASTARRANPQIRIPNPKTRKHVYFFGGGKADGNRNMKDLLGGKGSGLAEMTNAGLPVPPGFTISTEVCNIYYKEKRKIPPADRREIAEHVKKLEKAAGATLGSTENPLLVSVRSGAKFSMPGHDGHDSQPRPQRRCGRRAEGGGRRTAASRSTATAASSRCSATSCSRSRRTRSSTSSRR